MIPPEPPRVHPWGLSTKARQAYDQILNLCDIICFDNRGKNKYEGSRRSNHAQVLQYFLRVSLAKHPELLFTVEDDGSSSIIATLIELPCILEASDDPVENSLGANLRSLLKCWIARNPFCLLWVCKFADGECDDEQAALYHLVFRFRDYPRSVETAAWVAQNFIWVYVLVKWPKDLVPHAYLLKLHLEDNCPASAVKYFFEHFPCQSLALPPAWGHDIYYGNMLHFCFYDVKRSHSRQRGCCPHLFRWLVDQYPEALTGVDYKDRRPLYQACKALSRRSYKYSPEVALNLTENCLALIEKSPLRVFTTKARTGNGIGLLPLDKLALNHYHDRVVAIALLKKYYAWSPGYKTKALPMREKPEFLSNRILTFLEEVQYFFETKAILMEECHERHKVSELLKSSNEFPCLGEAYAAWASTCDQAAEETMQLLSDENMECRTDDISEQLWPNEAYEVLPPRFEPGQEARYNRRFI